MTKMSVVFFWNGVTSVFKDGKQAPDLQVPWFQLFLEHLDALEIDPRDAKFTLPNGKQAEVFLTDLDEWSWRIT